MELDNSYEWCIEIQRNNFLSFCMFPIEMRSVITAEPELAQV